MKTPEVLVREGQPGHAKRDQFEQCLPLRDWWLLPSISILTIILMLSVSEIVARTFWSANGVDNCSDFNGVHGRFHPTCKSKVKTPEGPWVENAYNECGYRTAQSCGPKQRGTLRVAVLGTSFAYGFDVPYSSVYSTVVAQTFERRCGKHIDFQNVTAPGIDMLAVYRRTDEALALKPDLVVLAITPFDIRRDISAEQLAHRDDPPDAVLDKRRPVQGDGFLKRTFVTPVKESRAVYMLQHFMYQDPDTYLRLYLLYGDAADFVRTPFSPAWQKHFDSFDILLAGMEKKAQAASVPMLILIGPTVAGIAVENTAPKPLFNAYAFTQKVSSIASKYQIPVVDPSPQFKGIPHPMSFFYVVDGHLNASGQTLVAQTLDEEIISGRYPGFAGCQAH